MLNLDYIRRNNKKILAVIGAFLMVAFILPNFNNTGQRFQPGEFGKAYGKLITANEYAVARGDVQILTQHLIQRQYNLNFIELTLAQRLGMGLNQQSMREVQRVAANITPLNLVLLLREARKMNVIVPEDSVQEVMAAFPAAPGEVITSDEKAYRAQAIQDWLTVLTAYDRIAQVARMSPAMAEYRIASAQEEVALDLVDFRSVDFEKAAGKPTDAQLQAFFEKHRDQNRDSSPEGVGYRFPNRVRLQYVKVTKAQVLKTITSDDSAEYWYTHQSQFERLPESTTQPASRPATTQPTTRPWVAGNDVDKEIRDQLADERVATIAKEVQQRLNAEWPAFREAAKNEKKAVPSHPPETDMGVPYNSYSFLRRVCEKVQKTRDARGVLPEAVELDKLYSAPELRELTDIGKAALGNYPLPDYVTTFVEPFMNDKLRKQADAMKIPVLVLYEPARLPRPFTDAAGNMYVFRVTEADPARAAGSLAEVREQVQRDWLALESLKKAHEAADKFLSVVRSKGLVAAADAAGMKAIKTGLFANRAQQQIKTYPLPEQAMPAFIKGAFGLYADRVRTDKPHPAGVIELPLAQRVVVAEVEQAKPAEKGFELEFGVRQIEMQYPSIRATESLPAWFDPDNVKVRVKYEIDERFKRSSEAD